MTNDKHTISRKHLQSRIDKIARSQIAHLPTPLEFCPRLTEELGGPQIWMKRDDCTGLALGGNKTRQLEFILADYIYLAGANITPAGLALGAKALGRKTKVIGITPIHWDEDRSTDIARIASATAERLGLDVTFSPEEIHNEDGYVGERYGVMTPECRQAMKLVAQTEGIILDPVYSSKAMAGLIDHIHCKRIGENETVVFLHTGGTPALFAYAEDLQLAAGEAL